MNCRQEFESVLNKERETWRKEFSDHKKSVEGAIDKRLVATSLVAIAVLAVGWWSATSAVRQKVTERLDKEFATENIKTTISEAAHRAAGDQTKRLMEQVINPATTAALAEIKQKQTEMSVSAANLQRDIDQKVAGFQTRLDTQEKRENASLSDLKQDYTKELAKLRDLVAYQEKFKEIQVLRGQAVSGDYASLEKLSAYSSNDANLMNDALANMLEAKTMYLTGGRTEGTEIYQTIQDGSKLTNERISTDVLITAFLMNTTQNWLGRAKAAKLLGSRREARTPEALLNSMNTDPNLWVRREALKSFEGLTGFKEADVFAFPQALEWWKNNKDSYLKTLPKTP